jgi:hypothetical protein
VYSEIYFGRMPYRGFLASNLSVQRRSKQASDVERHRPGRVLSQIAHSLFRPTVQTAGEQFAPLGAEVRSLLGEVRLDVAMNDAALVSVQQRRRRYWFKRPQ